MFTHDFSLRILIAGPLCILVMFLVLILNLGNPAALDIYSFAVDSSDQIYVGTINCISVYQNGELIRTIDPPTSRGYLFTIQKEDTLTLFAGSRLFTIDVNGNILESVDYMDASPKDIPSSSRTFISSNGDVYKLKRFIGIPQITKNETEVVYRASGTSIIAAMIGGVAASIFVVLIIWEIIDALRNLLAP